MATSSRVAFGSFTIDSVSRTPITMPRQCSRMVIHNSDLTNDVTLFDASTGGNSRKLNAGGQQVFGWNSALGDASEVVCWAQADAGTGPLIAEYYQ